MNHDREAGPRINVTVCIALPPALTEDMIRATQDFERWLCETYGGYTRDNAQGGWKSETGEMMHEPVLVYRVSFPLGEKHWTPGGYVDAIAKQAGLAGWRLGQEWVHVEYYGTNAAHIRCASLSRE